MNTNRCVKNISTMLGILMLASCSVLSPIKSEPTNTYQINSIPSVPNKHHPRALTLIVMPVETMPVYNTKQMAYSVSPYQIAYFVKNGWAETPGSMLHSELIQTLEKTNDFRAVISSRNSGQADYALNMQLLELQQDFTSAVSVVRLKVNVELTRLSDNRIVASKTFSFVEPAPQNNPYSGVQATNRAAASLMRQVTLFCLRKTHGL